MSTITINCQNNNRDSVEQVLRSFSKQLNDLGIYKSNSSGTTLEIHRLFT